MTLRSLGELALRRLPQWVIPAQSLPRTRFGVKPGMTLWECQVRNIIYFMTDLGVEAIRVTLIFSRSSMAGIWGAMVFFQ